MKKLYSLLSVFILLPVFTLCQSVEDPLAEQILTHLSGKTNSLNSPAELDALIQQAGSGKLVLLGESSHGTNEFYAWRAEISKRLIIEKKFSFIAVEGDWASIYRLNEYVKGKQGAPSSARKVLLNFSRWPEWMWANTEIEKLAEWLKTYNEKKPEEERIGFYGMDVYGQWEAMDDLLVYTKKYLPEYHREIQRRLQCFARYDRDEWRYARAVGQGHPSCESELNELVAFLQEMSEELIKTDEAKYFRAKQNALVVKNAEDFFRLAVADNADSWNSRARHMWLSVQRLLALYGEDSKGIVWAHNTHVGDARATSMAFHQMVNIGQLSREDLGKDKVFITGFGTYTGRVNAGSSWGSAMQRMQIPAAMPASFEALFNRLEKEKFYLVFDESDRLFEPINQYRGHRAIGVVYNPRQEAGNYVPTILPQRYDAFIFIRETNPLVPVR